MFQKLRPVSRLVNVADTATILRRSMLGLAAAGIVATTVELATLRHWTTATQLIPWLVLGVLAIGVLIVALGGSRQMIRVVRMIALLAAVSGIYGLYIHVKANYDAAILDYHYTDRWPQMSLISKLWAAGSGQVGPSPVMAPAVLSQCAVCLALATFRHPKLAAVRVRRAATTETSTAMMSDPVESSISSRPEFPPRWNSATTHRRNPDKDLRPSHYCQDNRCAPLCSDAPMSCVSGRRKIMNVRIASTAPAVSTSADTILRGLGAVLLLGVAQIHFLDVFDKFEENVAQGWMFAALIVGCLAATLALVHKSSLLVWMLAALCGLAPLGGYIISRWVGLAGATDDIGNWTEPLGLASVSTEVSLVLISAYALLYRRQSPASAEQS